MYGPYVPQQMGYRSSALMRRRSEDNRYVNGSPRVRRSETVQAERISPVSRPRKPLTQPKVMWYDCSCGRQTRTQGPCNHAGIVFAGIDNSGKDHL